MNRRQTFYGLLVFKVFYVSLLGCGSTADKARPRPEDSMHIQQDISTHGAMKADADSSLQMSTDGIKAKDERAALITGVLRREFAADLEKGFIDEPSRRFYYDTVNLNGSGTAEFLVALNGTYFCGSGGCTTLLLDSSGKVTTLFSVVQYPILLDTAFTNGWRNLIVYSGGSFRAVRMQAKGYPANPSIQPAIKNPGKQLRKVLDIPAAPYPAHTF